jgi:cytochrome bd-type quinol oxidase subunit 2
MRKRKSIPFYIVCFCLALIIGSSLFAVLWQPSFEHGIISIKIMDSYVAYNLWGFLGSVVLLVIFMYFTIRVCRFQKRDKPAFFTALLAGFIFIFLLDYITYGWTSYPPLAPLGIKQLTAEKYNLILLVIKGIVIAAIAFLIFKWFKLKTDAANRLQATSLHIEI